jgi:hypothetical protein
LPRQARVSRLPFDKIEGASRLVAHLDSVGIEARDVAIRNGEAIVGIIKILAVHV